MKKRAFGRTGVQVSEIGLGAWQISGSWGDVPEHVAKDILRTAAENGVSFFDTADVYGDGRSERLIGEFLRESGAKTFVATKLGRTASLYPDKYTEAGLRAATEASLQHLGVEALDLTQLHCVPAEILLRGEVFGWLEKLKTEGKIRHWGASVESMEEAQLCLKQDGLASLQIIFNIFRQKPIATLFDAAQAKGVALIVRLPLASGLLAGKFTKDSQFPAEDHRNFNCDGQAFNVGETFAGLPFAKGVELADGLKPLVPPGLTMAQMALRWILDHPAVSTIIPGAKNVRQVLGNVSPSALPELEEDLHEKLRKFYESEVADHIRGPY